MKLLKSNLRFILFLLSSIGSSASLSWDLENVFSGMNTNVTSPGSYHDAMAGYYSGGGFSMRMQHNSVCSPLSLTPPELKMGCSGIDMYMGSFSMISGKQLVQIAKNIGTQAASYGFQLSLKTFAPQIENLLSKLRDMAMDLNQFSVEDCHAVQSVFASVLHKDSAMYETVCKDLAQRGGAKDYFKARENCENNAEARKVAREHQRLSNEEQLTGDYNLFLVAAKKANVPEKFRMAMMSIAGTIVMKDGEYRPYNSLVKNNTPSWVAYLKGGEADLYTCRDPDLCLQVTQAPKNIPVEQSYQAKAATKLTQIKRGMVNNQAFSKEDKEFLSSIGDTFPIYDYISLEVVSGISIMDKATELVATFMIVHYLNEVINEVRHAAQVLEAKQINDQHIKEYLAELDQTQVFISGKYQELMHVAFNLEKTARFLEGHQIARAR